MRLIDSDQLKMSKEADEKCEKLVEGRHCY